MSSSSHRRGKKSRGKIRSTDSRSGAAPSRPAELTTTSKFVSEDFPKLYHYTDANGLKGIIENNELWATHYQYLNDFTEVAQSRDRILPLALKRAKESFQWWNDVPSFRDNIDANGGYDKVVTHEISTILDATIRVTVNTSPPFFTSFAGHTEAHEVESGSLDLWRAYSKDSVGGYCVVLDTKSLENMLAEEAKAHKYYMLHMVDINYSDEDAKDIADLASSLVSVLNGFIGKMDWPVQGNILDPDALYGPAAVEMTRHKSAHFRSEREVRLVASPQTRASSPSAAKITGRPIFHRVSGGCLVPTLKVFDDRLSPLPIERIIVGPSDRQEQRATGARSFIKSLGRTAEVSKSLIPYRLM